MNQNCFKKQIIVTTILCLLAAGTLTTGIQVHTTLTGSFPIEIKSTYESGKEAVCFDYILTKNPSSEVLAFGATFEAVFNDSKLEINTPLRYAICAKKGEMKPIILETE